ncbi:putative V-type ATP synthase subunit E [Ruminococcaceae bacterium BL-6]|nr:putative V-type ATP synthase subunit E [Ruminococcaceae bacterium BL-6]
MMASVNNEKINKFNLAINHYAQEQREKIEKEIAEYKRRELEEAEREVLNEAYRMIQKEMAAMRDGITRERAHREMAARKELLEKRRKITETVFRKAAERLRSFTETEKYAALLQKFARNLSGILPDTGTVLCLRPDDLKYGELLKKAFGGECTVQADREISIGGIRAYHTGRGIMADETLDTMLEAQRGWFEETSGMAVV